MSTSDTEIGLAFILTAEVKQPQPDEIIAAAKEMGIVLTLSEGDEEEEDEDDDQSIDIDSYDIEGGGSLIVALFPARHPDVAEMAQGPLSPEEMDDLIEAPAHCVVTAMGLQGTVDEMDMQMAALTTAVMAGCSPVGVMQMPGVIFHRPDLFAEAAKQGLQDNQLPFLICVDITAAREGESEMSFLTHNMDRYGREDLYVTAAVDGQGALDFMLTMVSWLLEDREYKLGTGETVGRNADEQILIQRVPSPLGEGPEVIRLDLG